MSRTLAFICFMFLLSVFFEGGDLAAGGGRFDQTIEKKVVDLVNRARLKGAHCGNRYFRATKPIVWNDGLAQAARKHSKDMAAKESLGHKGSDGSGTGDRIARCGYRWMMCGENVGEGYLTPEEVVNSWLKSQGHCENIMNPGFKEAGAAYAKGRGRMYWTLVLAAPEFSEQR